MNASRLAPALAGLALLSWMGSAAAVPTYPPNAVLPGGTPGYSLMTDLGLGPNALFGLTRQSACIPVDPCVPQALSLADPTRPSIFNGTHATEFNIVFGLKIGAGQTVGIRSIPALP